MDPNNVATMDAPSEVEVQRIRDYYNANVSVTAISALPSSINLLVGQDSDISAAASLLDTNTLRTGTTKHASEFVFQSDDPGVATVRQSGHVSAVASGSATISIDSSDPLSTAVDYVTVTDRKSVV